jgi:ABC-type sulfate transport system substrate-binding protein
MSIKRVEIVEKESPVRRAIPVLTLLVALVAALAATTASARSTETRLSVVGYAVPREALGAIIKAWQQTADGKDVGFTQSYQAVVQGDRDQLDRRLRGP